MKSTKKILALAMAAVMALSMGTTAFAAEMGPTGVIESTDNTIVLKKEIVFINADGADVYEPNISYSYTIAPAAPNETAALAADRTTITDVDEDFATVQAGPAAGASINAAGVVFSASNPVVAGVEATGTKSVTRDMSVTIDPTAFGGKAGVYRYKITEAIDNTALANAGITRSTNYDNVRYLDVYLRNNAQGTALEVYGYVLFDGTDTDSLDATSVDPASADLPVKTQGFVRDDDVALGIDNVDVYYTYNMKVTKSIEGDMADKTHDFPFTFELSNTDAAAAYTYEGTKKTFDGVDIATALGHNDFVEFKGLPANAVIDIIETNDTYDVYKVDIANSLNGAVPAEVPVEHNNDRALGDVTTPRAGVHVTDYSTPSVANAASATQQYHDITFTNTLDAVSPTGVLMRVLPFMLMLMVGCAAVVLVRKMNKHSYEL